MAHTDKRIEDYLHLYLGCEVAGMKSGERSILSIIDETVIELAQKGSIKAILRPLSDMSEEEMKEYIMILFTNKEIKIDFDEISADLFQNDGGNMVDGDVEIGADISCRCYVGQIAIRKCGSTHLFDEAGEPESVYNLPEAMRYLLSKHFDLFGLIEAGLAIDKTSKVNRELK